MSAGHFDTYLVLLIDIGKFKRALSGRKFCCLGCERLPGSGVSNGQMYGKDVNSGKYYAKGSQSPESSDSGVVCDCLGLICHGTKLFLF